MVDIKRYLSFLRVGLVGGFIEVLELPKSGDCHV